MSIEKNLGQTSLPGMDILGKTLHAYVQGLDRHADASHEEAAVDAWINCLQDTVWSEYAQQILASREQAWLAIQLPLLHNPNVEWRESADYHWGGVQGCWKFATQQSAKGTMVEVVTSVVASCPDYRFSQELRDAKRYLQGHIERYDQPLLGMEPEGKRRKQTVPKEKLSPVFQERLLTEVAEKYHLKVVAQALGYDTEPSTLFSATITAEDHDSQARKYYLEHEHASAVKKEITSPDSWFHKEGLIDSNLELTNETVLAFLRKQLAWDDKDTDYQKLPAILEIINQSNPLLVNTKNTG